MEKIVAKNIKDMFQIYLVLPKIVAENKLMESKYIFVPCDGRFDANIFLKGIFYILR